MGVWLVVQRIASGGVQMEAAPEYKIILLGEPGVGKTSFFLRLRNGTFAGSSAVSASIGTESLDYSMTISGVTVKVSEGERRQLEGGGSRCQLSCSRRTPLLVSFNLRGGTVVDFIAS